MNGRRLGRALFAAFLMIALPPQARAQSRQFLSVQGSGLLTSLRGNAFDLLRIGTGLGGEFQVRINPGSVSFGAGYQITTHSSTSQGLANHMTLSGVFFEPRYAIAISSRVVSPYVAGRLALMMQKTDLEDIGTTYQVKANAFAFGGGGGFVARLSNRVNFDLGLALTATNFGEFKYRNTGSASGLDAGSGTIFVMKAGLNVGLGS
jgi:hypothetical protein